MNLLNCRV